MELLGHLASYISEEVRCHRWAVYTLQTMPANGEYTGVALRDHLKAREEILKWKTFNPAAEIVGGLSIAWIGDRSPFKVGKIVAGVSASVLFWNAYWKLQQNREERDFLRTTKGVNLESMGASLNPYLRDQE